jgi:hypothetical protein
MGEVWYPGKIMEKIRGERFQVEKGPPFMLYVEEELKRINEDTFRHISESANPPEPLGYLGASFDKIRDLIGRASRELPPEDLMAIARRAIIMQETLSDLARAKYIEIITKYIYGMIAVR